LKTTPWDAKILHEFSGSDGFGQSGYLTPDGATKLYGFAGSAVGKCPDQGYGEIFALEYGKTGWAWDGVLYRFTPDVFLVPQLTLYEGKLLERRPATTFHSERFTNSLPRALIQTHLQDTDLGRLTTWELSRHKRSGFTSAQSTIGSGVAMRVIVSFGFAIALVIWSAGTVLAAPSPFLPPQRTLPSATRVPLSVNPGVLYNFGSGADANPVGGLTYLNGILYGETCTGGLGDPFGLGTVFAVNAEGTERVIHSFGKGTDGACPLGGLVAVNDVLYGITTNGGRYGVGTVFATTPGGTERVLHDFGVGADGGFPFAGLIAVNGVLYGTTAEGGKYGSGAVFAITTDGAENVVYSFDDNRIDADYPWSNLIYDNGVFYSTSQSGGTNNNGAVYSVTAAGAEHVLYSFTGGADGGIPQFGLIEVNGVFYGTTYSGGTYGQGTVFSVSKAGTERVLHNFGRRPDGRQPQSSLINVNGTLYGTTSGGGRYSSGTVFAITTAGSESVIRDFRLCDGPEGQLIDVNGVLYGTTQFGGTYHSGALFFNSP
jgi:uncharacterized repeat protein (TIGR03803 family)